MAGPGLPEISVREAAARLEDGGSGALLVDVRERGEFTALRVAGAVLMPLSEFGLRFRELPADRPLLMFCRSGNRSAMATDFLLRQGFTEATNVAGGIVAWHAAGLPTRSGPPVDGEGSLAFATQARDPGRTEASLRAAAGDPGTAPSGDGRPGPGEAASGSGA